METGAVSKIRVIKLAPPHFALAPVRRGKRSRLFPEALVNLGVGVVCALKLVLR